ncbi:MAG TPA: hypothetical protein PKX93_12140 [bacterium]|nr:hypothetical protein [bacterium]HOL68197.1 hypothetical protein [bacterium]HPP11624.1 hypothetical protein [bacterium]
MKRNKFHLSAARCRQALISLILFSAILHLILLAALAVQYRDLTFLNYFHILELHRFFPRLVTGQLTHFLSLVAIFFLFLIIYSLTPENKLRKTENKEEK